MPLLLSATLLHHQISTTAHKLGHDWLLASRRVSVELRAVLWVTDVLSSLPRPAARADEGAVAEASSSVSGPALLRKLTRTEVHCIRLHRFY